MRSALYEGTLMHARTVPTRNVFRYPVCFYGLDLDELPELDRRIALFGYNRRNVVTFRDGDHLGDPARPVKENVLAFLAGRGIDLGPGGRVTLITNLRLLGYVFNPVSYFYCYRADGELAAIVAEVSNTFGERHPYLLTSDNQVKDGARRVYEHPKRMHVSPFFGMDQTYRFSFTEPGEKVHAGVGIIEGDAAAVLGRADRRAPAAHQRGAGPRPHALPTDVAAGDRTHPLAGGEARNEEGALPSEAAVLPGQGSRPAPEPSGAVATLEPPARDGGTVGSGRTSLRPLPPARRSPFTPLARRAALWGLGNPVRGRIRLELPDGTVRHGGDPATGPEITVTVNSKNLWRRLATRGRLAIGESYVAGDWRTDDLVGLLETLALSGERARHRPPWSAWMELQRRRPHLPPRSDLPGAKRDIQYHYDLGNDLYELFLDPSWTYSCAFFEHPGMSLQEAQEAKYRRICDKLGLGPDSHVLEIGCGWGGFALHAAREWGARVTGLTLSEEQAALARERIAEAGLSDRIEILLQDYRRDGGALHPHRVDRDARGHRSPRAAGLLPGGRPASWRRAASPASRRSRCPTRPTSATAAGTTGSASTSSPAR